MTAEKFEATQGNTLNSPPIVKTPRTEALRRFKDILQAKMTDCADAIVRMGFPYGATLSGDAHHYRGKMDGFAAVLGLLETLGPQIEEEAHERGYEQGSQEAYDNPRKPSR